MPGARHENLKNTTLVFQVPPEFRLQVNIPPREVFPGILAHFASWSSILVFSMVTSNGKASNSTVLQKMRKMTWEPGK